MQMKDRERTANTSALKQKHDQVGGQQTAKILSQSLFVQKSIHVPARRHVGPTTCPPPPTAALCLIFRPWRAMMWLSNSDAPQHSTVMDT